MNEEDWYQVSLTKKEYDLLFDIMNETESFGTGLEDVLKNLKKKVSEPIELDHD